MIMYMASHASGGGGEGVGGGSFSLSCELSDQMPIE